ncbi:hypothetical protein [Geomicrobium sediminis]|uniref:Na+-transporting methylmalonyl-CoA/oxaloacetate decarboxylase gamma subunit n=1 Tax=Geomicrobium sediminis TaxID=1347788 RepID=A0ABS2PD24_9BACL|nr:hypothetical protein [Geomicrobium sediminis]MBM7632856.1 Na+-transporting methylmalonyl-CoA/oxaloacetate decarboxylase gamma subunit [Geomicrobium sediminis]
MRAFNLFLLNLQNELPKHRQMIRIGSYMFFIVLSFLAFIITTINYFNNPLIEDLSANQYYIAPFIVGFLGAAIVLVFGFFFTNVLLLVSSKKIRFFNVEIEFDTSEIAEKKAGQTINYLSKVIESHRYALAKMRAEDRRSHLAILMEVMRSYQTQLRAAYDDHEIEVKVYTESHDFTKGQSLLIADLQYLEGKQKIAYKNRIKRKSTNLMIAETKVEEVVEDDELIIPFEQTVYIVVSRNIEDLFDDLDTNTLKGLIHYAEVVKNEIEMLDIVEYDYE